jgi:putative selenate reductase
VLAVPPPSPPPPPLAFPTAERFLRELGGTLPLSFSAGIDGGNAAEALACGFAPLTLCTELLRAGGWGRFSRLLAAVEGRMRSLRARNLYELRLHAFGAGEAGLEEAGAIQRFNLGRYARSLPAARRSRAAALGRGPRSLPQPLKRLDCLSCDLCLTACPNGAFFLWETPGAQGPRRQYALWADACNDCGNCELWCPEAGAPQLVKERFFGGRAALEAEPLAREGFVIGPEGLQARLAGRWLHLGWEAPAGPQAEDGEPVPLMVGARLRQAAAICAPGAANPAAIRRERLAERP